MIFPNFLQEALNQLKSNLGDIRGAIEPMSLHESSLSYSDTKEGFLGSAGILFTKNIMYPERFGSARVTNKTEAIKLIRGKETGVLQI